MRKVSVLSLATFVAVAAFVAAPVQGATLYGVSNGPDFGVGTGEPAEFNLGGFFESTSGADVSYTASSGATVDADGNVTINGMANPGMSTITFTATSGSDSVSFDSDVYVGTLIGNGPSAGDNNRMVGASGNVFLNPIVPGSTVNSSVNLDLPAMGGGTTPNGGTGAAALITTIAEVELTNVDNTGFMDRDVEVLASGTTTASAQGLTATLNANGSYSLAAGNDFSDDLVVTFGVDAGAAMDAVHLVAAPAVNVDLASALPVPIDGFASGTLSGNTITVGAGQGMLLIGANPLATDGEVTVSANYSASAALSIAVIAFDSDLAGLATAGMNFNLVSGANMASNGEVTNLSVVANPQSGNVMAGIQVVNTGTASATVQITNFQIVQAGPVMDYAINPNAEADLGIDASLASLDGVSSNILGSAGVVAGTLSTENNFVSGTGSGSLQLNASATAAAQAFVQLALEPGDVVAECYIQGVAAPTGGNFILALLDAAQSLSAFSIVVPAQISTDGWQLVETSSTVSAAGGTYFLIAQAAQGTNVVVDDLAVRVIADTDAMFDANLLGM